MASLLPMISRVATMWLVSYRYSDLLEALGHHSHHAVVLAVHSAGLQGGEQLAQEMT